MAKGTKDTKKGGRFAKKAKSKKVCLTPARKKRK